jgi:hypothetical protein
LSDFESQIECTLVEPIIDGTVEAVFTEIRQNGVFVSERWHIGEEGSTGDLYIRDVTDSLEGINARYMFRNGTYVNL